MNWFEKVKRYYDMGKYTNEQVKVFVQGKKITEQEYELITGEKYEAIVEQKPQLLFQWNDMNFYKDPNGDLGHIVEFNNADKDKLLELSFDQTIKQIDRYDVGSEIQISK